MNGHALSSVLVGLEPVLVRVTAEPTDRPLEIHGLSEHAAREIRTRVRAALTDVDVTRVGEREVDFSTGRVTIHERSAGVVMNLRIWCLDLAVAVALLRSRGFRVTAPEDACFVGELALDGCVRRVRGLVARARRTPVGGSLSIPLVVPACSIPFPGAHEGPVYGIYHLSDLLRPLKPAPPLSVKVGSPPACHGSAEDLDRVGLRPALDACFAAPGPVLLVGPPGSGKTMVARRIAAAMPPLTREEAIALLEIKDAGGIADVLSAPVERPFRAPHHTASAAALVGGGVRPQPGEASLAHHGVLFLDEATEFSRLALDDIAHVLQRGEAAFTRGDVVHRFPARPAKIVLASNPCACGWSGMPSRRCTCSADTRRAYGEWLETVRALFGATRIEIPAFQL